MAEEEPLAEMDLRSKVKELEALVANLQDQNETLRKENGTLSTRLAEFENNLKKEVDCEQILVNETLPQTDSSGTPSTSGGVAVSLELECQIENQILDSKSKVRGKRMKKRNSTARSMSHYCTRHVALKVMYLGSRYQGFASQAGSQRTVEAELFAALQRTRLISETAIEAKYTRCGRTDKGVSATGQVIALYLRSKRRQEELVSTEDTEMHANSESLISIEEVVEGETEGLNTKSMGSVMDGIRRDGDRVAMARASRSLEEHYTRTASVEDELDYVGILNRALPEDIRVLGWCPVPPGFSARSVFDCDVHKKRVYDLIDISMYHTLCLWGGPDSVVSIAMKVACKKFEGDHDFTNFCKMDASSVHNYRRTISNFDILSYDEEWGGKSVWMMKVKGTAFLWHQVRCMAAVLFMVGHGHESPTIIEEMLDVKNYVRKPQYIMAPETPLLLFQCGYQGLSFHVHPDSMKHLRLHLESMLDISIVNSSLLLQGLLDLPPPADDSTKTGDSQSRKGAHALLRNRLTQPTYEERRRRMQRADSSDLTS